MSSQTLLNIETIILDSSAGDRQAVIKELAKRLQSAGYLNDEAAFLASVEAREQHASTGIGFGVAIPHGKSAGVIKPGLAFARLALPIDWGSLDGKPVTSIILLAIPESDAGKEHLRILASVSRKLIHESFRQELLDGQSAADILKTLESAL
ncbi:fructose PTS transporter subunit IIA [Paenibacillus algorifonticola]|uniref:PTS sugar transporter subunit IIA n=1 Tax=Paenibacillus algorifonticola TaxID=684063 RepID=UPI003D2CBE54